MSMKHTDNRVTTKAVEGGEEPQETETAPQMCCDGQKTAEEHRHESPDGKCCVD